MKKLALFEGSWQKVLIKVVVLLLILFVAYRILKEVFNPKRKKSKEVIDNYIVNELPNTTPVDDSNPTDPETISDSEAQLIAQNLEVYMNETTFGIPGTNEQGIFNSLQCLNGASLNKVYAEFGARNYEGTTMDLFGWFGQEFSNTVFGTLIHYNDCVPGCESYWDQCRDLSYLRAIWSKSSIPITF